MLSIQIDRSPAMTPTPMTFALDLPNLQKMLDQLFDDLVTVWLLDDL